MVLAKELIEILNTTDESTTIEAKVGSSIDKSIMETICAFSNEPNLGGGYILLGLKRDEESLFPSYETVGLENLDKLQLDLSSQAASLFNTPIRPECEVEVINEKAVLKVFIPEVSASQKPVYFKNKGLPRGAFRRIGTSDQSCSDDDMPVFYTSSESFDSALVTNSSLADVDENALERYRNLRAKVNPYAEELNYSDKDLLLALGAARQEAEQLRLTYTGLLVFGSGVAQRRLLPSFRVDYIRVPGNEWVADPENRFTTIDMRGSLLLLAERAYSAIVDDLPKGFLLPDGKLQAESIGLPGKALREALVNALMHRSYRVNQPIQIIRYANRLEIKNPGFSLKQADDLGKPGSLIRNQYIAAIFHETNLAETKGSGIAIMRKLMHNAHLAPPVFESDHLNNHFSARLLLHHFLSELDLVWLKHFERFQLTDDQKKALIIVRELGAIDNQTYRQLSACDTLKASNDLRAMRNMDLLEAKGQSRATYYIAGCALRSLSEPVTLKNERLSALPQSAGNEAESSFSTPPPLLSALPMDLKNELKEIGARCRDTEKMKLFIVALLDWRNLSLLEIAEVMSREPKYILRKFLQPMIKEGIINYSIPEMLNHPDQAYTTKIK